MKTDDLGDARVDVRGLRAITFAAATIGSATSHVAFSGVGLLIVDRLKGWPHLSDPKSFGETFLFGDAIAAPTNYVLAIVLSILFAFAMALAINRRNSEDSLAVARKAIWVPKALAYGCVISALRYAFMKLHEDVLAGRYHHAYRSLFANSLLQNSTLNRVSLLVMTGIPLGIYKVIRSNSSKHPKTRTVSMVWDILTFWPRRFHPLGVPSYGQIAVPFLASNLEDMLEQSQHGEHVVLSAHSQGTVLSAAALARLAPDQRARISLVTYGSPLAGLFADAFPEQYPDAAHNLTGLAGWRNFYRGSDPIASVIASANTVDVELQDPRPSPDLTEMPANDEFIPLEWNRTAADGTARHSWYLADPELKSFVKGL